MAQINIRFTGERMARLKKRQWKILLKLTSGEFKPPDLESTTPAERKVALEKFIQFSDQICDVIGHFATNGDSNYIPSERVAELFDDMDFAEIMELANKFAEAASHNAVPLANAPQSPEQSTVMDEARPVGATP